VLQDGRRERDEREVPCGTQVGCLAAQLVERGPRPVAAEGELRHAVPAPPRECGAGVAAPRHRRQVIDGAEASILGQRLQHAQAERRRSNAAAGECHAHDGAIRRNAAPGAMARDAHALRRQHGVEVGGMVACRRGRRWIHGGITGRLVPAGSHDGA